LIGKKGVTNQGESYGTEFDALIKEQRRRPRRRHRRRPQGAVAGRADYLIAGYYPGLAEATKPRIKDQIMALDPDLLSAEMFVAFSKKSPCRSLAAQFGDQANDDRRQFQHDADRRAHQEAALV
jgi:polar amino acid transport system substrate-binding protein